MRYIGIDYSTRKLAVAVLGGDKPYAESFECNKKSDFEGCMAEIGEEMDLFISLYGLDDGTVNKTVLEAPIAGISRNIGTAIRMAMVAGMLFEVCSTVLSQQPSLVSNTRWKKSVCGRGNMRKEEVTEWLGQYRPAQAAVCSNQDEVDAMCMALYAESVEST